MPWDWFYMLYFLVFKTFPTAKQTLKDFHNNLEWWTYHMSLLAIQSNYAHVAAAREQLTFFSTPKVLNKIWNKIACSNRMSPGFDVFARCRIRRAASCLLTWSWLSSVCFISRWIRSRFILNKVLHAHYKHVDVRMCNGEKLMHICENIKKTAGLFRQSLQWKTIYETQQIIYVTQQQPLYE